MNLENWNISSHMLDRASNLMDDLFNNPRDTDYDRKKFLDKTTGIVSDCTENCHEICKKFDCPRLWDLETDEIIDHPGIMDHEIVAITHRWSAKEITYKDLLEIKRTNVIFKRLGQPLDSVKISTMSLKLAKIREELKSLTKYVWMDTLCIDKDSSTELDMSIRSMYRWYKASKFVYLEKYTKLQEWCTRGWTLQEGIAAKSIKISPLHGANFLEACIETGISIYDLGLQERGGHVLNSFGYLYLMSKRKTTRTEDMAYCLIGLLDVNINIAYGEGNKALVRILTQVGLDGDMSWILASIDYTIRIWDYFVRFPILDILRESYGIYDTYMTPSGNFIEIQLVRITGKYLKILKRELFGKIKMPRNKEKTGICPGNRQDGSVTFYWGNGLVFGVYNDRHIIYGTPISRELSMKLNMLVRETVFIWKDEVWQSIQNGIPLFSRCGLKRDMNNGFYTTKSLKECIKDQECDICSNYPDDDPRPRCPKISTEFGPTSCNSLKEDIRQMDLRKNTNES